MSQILRRFSCAALVACVAIGGATGTSAALADSNWTAQPLPTPALAPNGQLTGASCTSNEFCIAVGVAQDRLGQDAALAESWNGFRWDDRSAVTPRGAV